MLNKQLVLPGIPMEEQGQSSNAELTFGIEVEAIGFYDTQSAIVVGCPLIRHESGVVFLATIKLKYQLIGTRRPKWRINHFIDAKLESLCTFTTEEELGCEFKSPDFFSLPKETQDIWLEKTTPSISIIGGELSPEWQIIDDSWFYPRPNPITNVPAIQKSIDLLKSIGTNDWKVDYEPDITNAITNGFELQSPVFSGTNNSGFDSIHKVCEAFSPLSSSDTSCGLHIHIGVKDRQFTLAEIKGLISRWLQIEETVLTLPQYQQDNVHNEPLERYLDREIVNQASELSEFSDGLHVSHRRSLLLNLRPLGSYGTVEFRGFKSTLDSNQIVTLVKFCLGFVSSIVNG